MAEVSCETRNLFLDRALLVTTMAGSERGSLASVVRVPSESGRRGERWPTNPRRSHVMTPICRGCTLQRAHPGFAEAGLIRMLQEPEHGMSRQPPERPN